MGLGSFLNDMGCGLIETWDVLKFASVTSGVVAAKINRNMGCIEIIPRHFPHDFLKGLIETWDVLKCCRGFGTFGSLGRLIETWDVLKFYHFFYVDR